MKTTTLMWGACARRTVGFGLACGLAVLTPGQIRAAEPAQVERQAPSGKAPAGKSGVIEGAVISPFQNANVGAEVSGVIDAFRFHEGDPVQKGEIVVEISRRRYGALSQRAASARDARRVELEGSKKDQTVKDRLLSLHGTTEMVAQDAQSRREMAFAHLREASEDLHIAQINVEDCLVKAPFTGHLAVRYKQPFEPVDRLEKLFALVDTTKVYAVGNLSEDALDQFRVGSRAAFVRPNGTRHEGTVERMAKLIDPQSRTKRLYVLLDNPRSELEVGMTGSIERVDR